ncbi:MAG TPA: ATP-binding protein [Bryobacteraceae bacterium]|nr:ATP-binding protein [Bryobacteraceae bacterium]
MTLQAKLTLGSVILASLMVGLVSTVDLANDMQREFDSTLQRADTLKTVATKMVSQTINRQRTVPLREALRDPDLQDVLVGILTESRAILEVAVVDPHYEILLDTDPARLGVTSPPYPDFRPLVTTTSLYQKMRVLLRHDTQYYQLQQSLGTANVPLLYVRVIIDPALIRGDIYGTLQKSAHAALIFVIGAVLLTFLLSAVALRPLGQLGRMLDQVAKGEYEPEKLPAARPTSDEFARMASNVSMLGQRLRGAQFEVSDLRGNIDRLLQDLEDAVFIFNREMRLVFASGSVEKFLGTERGDLAGKSISDVFPPHTTLGLLIAQSAQTGRTVRNRRVPLSSPLDGSSPGVVLLSIDILESLPGTTLTGSGLLVRLRDPEAQRKIGRELQTADRLAALSRVSGGVAHEVKNPLNAILLHVEVARAKLAHGDTDVEPQMDIISREILRLDRVVKTFLDFTRPVELNLSTVPLQDLMREVVDLARPQAEASKIRVSVEQDVENVAVRVDRDLLKQAFLNVVVNAIEAMPEGGELRFVSTASEDTADVRIADTGPGIPQELREKIFRLYFTTKKEGSGIGLAMTFRIVQLHDGTIDFTSEPGKGTTFLIRLPIAA